MKILVLCGPSASGKTTLSFLLKDFFEQKGYPIQLINFDSLNFFSELEIGSARPSLAQIKKAQYAFMGHVSVTTNYHVAPFIKEATLLIESKLSQGIIPVLCGGSAFYLRALVKGLFVEKEDSLKDSFLVSSFADTSKEELIAFLEQNDPDIFKKVHPNDRYRLERAASFFKENKYPFSSYALYQEDSFDLSKNNKLSGIIIPFYLDWKKEDLHERIELRVQEMFEKGLLLEIKKLQALFSPKEISSLKALKSIGYKEIFELLSHKTFNDFTIDDINLLKAEIILHTKQLAKSQRTFFKKFTPLIKIPCDKVIKQSEILQTIFDTFRDR